MVNMRICNLCMQRKMWHAVGLFNYFSLPVRVKDASKAQTGCIYEDWICRQAAALGSLGSSMESCLLRNICMISSLCPFSFVQIYTKHIPQTLLLLNLFFFISCTFLADRWDVWHADDHFMLLLYTALHTRWWPNLKPNQVRRCF
jgi:hypothetical protein